MALSEEKKPFKTKIPEKIMEEVSSFPSMPKAGIKLRALLAKNDVSVDDIEAILRHDPGLATNVLRLANSAFFGLTYKSQYFEARGHVIGDQAVFSDCS